MDINLEWGYAYYVNIRRIFMRKLKSFIALFVGLFLTVSLSAEEWFVCLGSFKDVNNAKVLVKELKNLDIEAFIYPTQIGDNLYNRVLLDEPFTQISSARLKAAALEDSGKLASLNIKGLWPCAAEKIEIPVVEEVVEKIPEEILPPVEEIKEVSEPEIFDDDLLGDKYFTDNQIKLIGNASEFIGVKKGKYKFDIDDNEASFTYILKKNKAFDLEEYTKNSPKPDDDGESYYLSIDDSFNYGSFTTTFRDKDGNISKPAGLRIAFDMETDIDDLSDFLMFAPVGKEYSIKCTVEFDVWGDDKSDEEIKNMIDDLIEKTDLIEMNEFNIEWYIAE